MSAVFSRAPSCLRSAGALGLALVVALGATSADAAKKSKKGQGSLEADASAPAATVFVDGKKVGTTPLKGFELSVGTREITIKKLGFVDHSEKVKVGAGKTIKVYGDLLPFAGVIKVSSNVQGAKVLVDGKAVGTAPGEFEVKLGQRNIEVQAPGQKSFKKKLKADPGNTYAIEATFAKGSPAPAADPLDDPLALAALPVEPVPTKGKDKGKAPAADPLDDPLALEPLAGPGPVKGGGDGELSLEALPEGELALVPPMGDGDDPLALAALPPSATTGTTVEEPTPWYLEWYVIAGAAAVVVGVAVAVGVAASSGESEPEHNTRPVDFYVRFGESIEDPTTDDRRFPLGIIPAF